MYHSNDSLRRFVGKERVQVSLLGFYRTKNQKTRTAWGRDSGQGWGVEKRSARRGELAADVVVAVVRLCALAAGGFGGGERTRPPRLLRRSSGCSRRALRRLAAGDGGGGRFGGLFELGGLLLETGDLLLRVFEIVPPGRRSEEVKVDGLLEFGGEVETTVEELLPERAELGLRSARGFAPRRVLREILFDVLDQVLGPAEVLVRGEGVGELVGEHGPPPERNARADEPFAEPLLPRGEGEVFRASHLRSLDACTHLVELSLDLLTLLGRGVLGDGDPSTQAHAACEGLLSESLLIRDLGSLPSRLLDDLVDALPEREHFLCRSGELLLRVGEVVAGRKNVRPLDRGDARRFEARMGVRDDGLDGRVINCEELRHCVLPAVFQRAGPVFFWNDVLCLNRPMRFKNKHIPAQTDDRLVDPC